MKQTTFGVLFFIYLSIYLIIKAFAELLGGTDEEQFAHQGVLLVMLIVTGFCYYLALFLITKKLNHDQDILTDMRLQVLISKDRRLFLSFAISAFITMLITLRVADWRTNFAVEFFVFIFSFTAIYYSLNHKE